jgi:general secretion pathway protein H
VKNSERGFTLIEIMIVVLIIALMMGLGVAVLFPGNEAKLRDQSSKIAGTVKFLYNESAIKNRYYRLVFDLDSQSYRVESSEEPYLVRMVDEAQKKKDEDKDPDATPDGAAFTAEEGLLVDPVRLPAGIKIKDISVMHLPTRVEQGKVEVYFFPNGFVEPAVVNLTDEDEENFYSLQFNPMTGRVRIRSEYFEVDPKDLSSNRGGEEAGQ